MTNSRLELELDRVAGESKVNVYLINGEVRVEYASQLSERMFERLVTGRDYRYAPYIAARICGVCSHAHFWASNLAIENALGIEVDEVTAILRDVCNKLQIVENHLVYLIFLALPDYRELEAGIVTKAIRAREIIKNSLNTVCGRLSGPQPYMPGGFIKEISLQHVEKTIKLMEESVPLVEEILEYVLSKVNPPSVSDPSPVYLALSTFPERSVPSKEPYILVSSGEYFTINEDNYLNYFNEVKSSYSNSKACTFNGKTFFVGARARLLANKYVELNSELLEVLRCNPYSNIVAKAIESRYLLRDIVYKLRSISGKQPRRTPPSRKQGKGLSVIEAPRGLLIHFYELDENSRIKSANIITPTVMFTKHVEASAEALIKQLYSEKNEENTFTKYVEMLVRSYDPCIPCAVHVVKVP